MCQISLGDKSKTNRETHGDGSFYFPLWTVQRGTHTTRSTGKKKREKEDLGITKEDTSNKEHEKHLENENDDKEKMQKRAIK